MNWNEIFSQAVTQGIGVQAVILALAAIGLNVHFGYTGMLNFGQAGFLAVAAYGLAVSVTYFAWSFWVGIAVGLCAATILALLLGIPTLKLRADYLAIVTIAGAEILRLLFRSVSLREFFGGSSGLTRFADEFFTVNPYRGGLSFGPFTFSQSDLWVVTVGWILIALSCAAVFAAMRSPWGRVLRAIREDEDAVRSLGKNTVFYKLQALVVGGVLGSLGGFIFAIANQSVQPDNYSTEFTFFAYTALILGGAARVKGPVIGAIVFWFLLTLIDNALNQAVSSGLVTILKADQVGQIRYIIMGLALMALMMYRPQGIFGDKREAALHVR